ncbi:unnamed protein product [Ectocarpus sp. CCAP 1310/34]|nr:unnamed protein product [Ectocarpus sp. CCAP 1310/34]
MHSMVVLQQLSGVVFERPTGGRGDGGCRGVFRNSGDVEMLSPFFFAASRLELIVLKGRFDGAFEWWETGAIFCEKSHRSAKLLFFAWPS